MEIASDVDLDLFPLDSDSSHAYLFEADGYALENGANQLGGDADVMGMTNANQSLPSAQCSTLKNTIKDKICLVCGDKALGYNFSVVSCESCKAFFRRNAHKIIRGRCSGECDITVESRSYCKKCRLRKCLAIGMKRDLILNEQQKKQRRQKILRNRLRREGVPIDPLAAPLVGENDGGSSSPNGLPSLSPTLSSPSSAPDPASTAPVTHVFVSDSATSSAEEGLCRALGPLMSAQGLATLAEMCKAFHSSFDGPMERPAQSPADETQFLNMAETSVRRMVKMAKQLTPFRKLEQPDQISLLKGAVVEVLILRSAKIFRPSAGGWQVSKNGSPHLISAAAFLRPKSRGTPSESGATGGEGAEMGNGEGAAMAFFDGYQRYVVSLLEIIRGDSVVLMLLIVMALLAPDREKLREKEHVAAAQEQYASLLKEYLAARYPKEDEHRTMFARALQKLTDIRNVNETHAKMLMMQIKMEELEPLIKEIFDLGC